MSEEPEVPSDPLVLRSFIMYEVLQNNSLNNAYRNFCKTVGDDVIDYEEFQFWYLRFCDGDMDVSYDRSADPKPPTFDGRHAEIVSESVVMISSNPNPPTFNDFTVEILAVILSHLDVKCRMISRRVCRKMEEASRQMPKVFEKISVSVSESRVHFHFDRKRALYVKTDSGCCVSSPLRRRTDLEDDYLTKAMDDLRILLEGSEIQIGTFSVSTNIRSEEILQTLQKICAKSESGQFEVIDLQIKTENLETTLSMLELIEPEPLKRMTLTDMDDVKPTDVSTLLATPQFEEAQKINLMTFAVIDAELIYTHFRNCAMFRVTVDSMSAEQFLRLKAMLTVSAMDPDVPFRRCMIRTKASLKPVFNAIRTALDKHDDTLRGGRNNIECFHAIANIVTEKRGHPKTIYLVFSIRRHFIKCTVVTQILDARFRGFGTYGGNSTSYSSSPQSSPNESDSSESE